MARKTKKKERGKRAGGKAAAKASRKKQRKPKKVKDKAPAVAHPLSLETGLVVATGLALITAIVFCELELSRHYGGGWLIG